MHLKYGIVSEVKQGFAKVHFEEDDIVTPWLPMLVRKSKSDKDSWPLEVNEHVACMMDKYCNEGVILGAIYSDVDTPDSGEGPGKFRKKFSDGTVIEYDNEGHELTVDVKGKLTAKTTGEAIIDAATNLNGKAGIKATIEAPAIELTGNVKITGTAIVTGALAAASISAGPSGGAPVFSISESGNMSITGKIEAVGNVESNGDVKAGAISLNSHVHAGVQSGTSSTGTPI